MITLEGKNISSHTYYEKDESGRRKVTLSVHGCYHWDKCTGGLTFIIQNSRDYKDWKVISIGYDDAEKLIIELQAIQDAAKRRMQASAPIVGEDVAPKLPMAPGAA